MNSNLAKILEFKKNQLIKQRYIRLFSLLRKFVHIYTKEILEKLKAMKDINVY